MDEATTTISRKFHWVQALYGSEVRITLLYVWDPYTDARSERPAKWHVWANAKGLTDAIRKHLEKEHREEYHRLKIQHKLKNWELLATVGTRRADREKIQESFNMQGLEERLVRYIVCCDEVSVFTTHRTFQGSRKL